jgi:hypothetical protein
MYLSKNNDTILDQNCQVHGTDAKYDELYDELALFMRMSDEKQKQWIRDNDLADDQWMNIAMIVAWREGL